MKKVYIIIAILASLLLAAMLTGIGYGMSRISAPKVVYKEIPTVAPTPTPTPTPVPEPDYEPEVVYINPWWEPENIEELKKNAPEPVTEKKYVNHKLGYEIIFPLSWPGWFIIDDSEPEDVRIMFYGKSEAGKFCKTSDSGYGIPLLNIVTEEIMEKKDPNWTYYVRRQLIDDINGINIYWGDTCRDMGLPGLAAHTTYYDENERSLAAADNEQMKKMYYDALDRVRPELYLNEIK